MSQYTMTLWEYLKAGNPLFDFPFHMWDESQRGRIQQLFADYYMFRELCTDNPEYWHHLFKTRWLLHWVYFNDLYQSCDLTYNPLTTHYMREEEEESTGRKYDENTASLGVTHGDSRMAEAGTLHSETETTLDSLTSGNEHETTDKVNDFWETVETKDKGTLDTTVDTTAHSVTDTLLDRDTHATGNLDKTVTGNSTRDKTGETDTAGTATNTHSDYPQANIAAVSPENPGQWATWNENSRTTSHADASEHETSNYSENTAQTTQDDSEMREIGKSTTDSTGKSVTDTDTTNTQNKSTHANTHEVTTRDLDTTTKTDQTEHSTTDTKTFNNAVGHTDGTTQQAVSRETSTTQKRGRGLTVSGYSGSTPSRLLQEYREALLNIDKQLINTFGSLFMEVF